MYELEFIPKNKNEESTWILHESKELTQELLDFIENEFEDNISDFEKVIVHEEKWISPKRRKMIPVNIIYL